MGTHSHNHHHHGHGHSHGEHGHSHPHGVRLDHVETHEGDSRRLLFAALLTGAFMMAEVIGGLVSGSLALLADAGHMLADFAGLSMAWIAFRLSRRPANQRRSYGLARLQVLAAFANGMMLMAVAAGIVLEAARRLFAPVDILTGPMLSVAILGLLVNAAGFAILHGGARGNLNMRGAIAHVLSDLLGSVGVIVAALIIMTLGWAPADPIISALVAMLIGRSAWLLVADASHVLLEGTPSNIPTAEIEADLARHVPGVIEVHHLHVWSLTEERPMATLHARLAPQANALAAIRAIKARLADRFDIDHATVEVEEGECADLLPDSTH